MANILKPNKIKLGFYLVVEGAQNTPAMMALKQLASNLHLIPGFYRFFSKPIQYERRGVETHIEKIESEIGDFQKLLVTRTLKLKKLGLPCKH